MFNSPQPTAEDLPSSYQLIKSTIIALISAIGILFTIVLPSEYGIDPTGIGELLGLKSMGDIKVSLKKEAIADIEASKYTDAVLQPVTDTRDNTALKPKNDIIERTLAPGEAIEIKLEMSSNAVARYSWSTSGGRLNFNKHGDGYKGTNQTITYKKGRMVSNDEGEILAAFDGYHGWFWRNREKSSVTVRLKTSGNYHKLKQIL